MALWVSNDGPIDLPHTYPTKTHILTEDKPLTSPSTNLGISAEMAILAPNVLVRGQVLEFKAATTREWKALQREWEQAAGAEGRG